MKYFFYALCICIFFTACQSGPSCPAYNSVSYEGRANPHNSNNDIEHKLSHLYEKRARLYREAALHNEIDEQEKRKIEKVNEQIAKTREDLENKRTQEKKDAALNGRIKRGRTSVVPSGVLPR